MAYKKQFATSLLERFKQLTALTQALVLIAATLLPLALTNTASAAQMSDRSATIDKALTSDTDVEFLFGYDLIDTAATKAGIIYEFCDAPLGACVLPTGMDVQTSNVHDAQASWPDNATAFTASTEAADVGDCTNNTDAFMICYERDETVATGTTGGAVTHTISGITAPSVQDTVFVRISVYSNDDFASGNLLDTGTVAVAFVDTLTINGRVQERLDFCVAAIDDDDVLGTVAPNVAACTGLTDTNVDIGIIDESSIARSPVEPDATNGADDDYGILMLNTNASGGSVISYYVDEDTGGTFETFAFRVDNATCTNGGGDNTDQCFESASNAGAGTTIAAGTEMFGVQIPCIDTSQGSTANLGSVPDFYNNADDDTSNAANCQQPGVDAGQVYGWNDSATTDTLTSASGVVDDEIVKLRFGATANATTPSGEYTVTTVYVATVTY